MSTAETGDAAVAKAVVDQAKELLGEAAVEQEQLNLIEMPTPEDLAEAREELGPNAGGLSVVRLARDKRRGRPAGSRNKRTDDFARYILGFGQDPAITLMQIQATPEEVLMERSRQEVTKVTKDGKVVTYEETMSFHAAESLRIRCAEALMPFVHSKKPVAVDMSIHSDFNLIEEITRGGSQDAIDAEFLEIDGAQALASPKDEAA